MAASTWLLSPCCVPTVAAAFSLCRVRKEERLRRYCFLQGLHKGVRIPVVGETRRQDKYSRCSTLSRVSGNGTVRDRKISYTSESSVNPETRVDWRQHQGPRQPPVCTA